MAFVCHCASPDCAARGCMRTRSDGWNPQPWNPAPVYPAPPQPVIWPVPYPVPGISEDDVRRIIREELDRDVAAKEDGGSTE